MLKISLKAARINAGLSQKEAAKLLKVSNKTLHSWENGSTYPSAKHIDAICELYKMTYDDLNFLPTDSLKVNQQ
jgi:transcriptional regulator with XRE-family HTH domain